MKSAEKKTYQERLQGAEDDLREVQQIIYYREEQPLHPFAAFLCHQVVEKAMEALLVFKNIEPPDTHDLVEIYNIAVEQEKELSKHKDDIESLDRYFFETQYSPGNEEVEYSLEEIEQAHEAARRVFHFIQKAITGNSSH